MSQGRDRDLQEDAVPLSPPDSGFSGTEATVQVSASRVTYSRAGNADAGTRLVSTLPLQSGASPPARSQLRVSPLTRGDPSSSTHQQESSGVDHQNEPAAEGASSHPLEQPDQGQQSLNPPQAERKKCGDEEYDEPSKSLQEDVLKGVNKALNQRLAESKHLDSSCVSVSSSSSQPSDDPCDVTDEDIEKYRHKFPESLKTDYFDAMIIYMRDDDESQVARFLHRVQTEVLLNKKIKPKVILFDEIFPNAGMNPIGQLDKSLSYCTYVFLYVTKSFCEDGWTEFSSQTALMDAILTPDKKWSVVPIFTEPKRRPTYKVPPSVRSLKGIQYWSDDKFYADSLRKLLEDKLEVRLDREAEQKHARKLWIMEKRTEERREMLQRQQELALKKKEEEMKKDLQDMVLKERERQESKKFSLVSEDEVQKMASQYAVPQSPNDYMKELFSHHGNFTSKNFNLTSSSSEPANLSGLGGRQNHEMSSGHPNVLMDSSFGHPAGFGLNPASQQPFVPYSPHLGHPCGYNPYHPGYIPPHSMAHSQMPGFSDPRFYSPGHSVGLWPPHFSCGPPTEGHPSSQWPIQQEKGFSMELGSSPGSSYDKRSHPHPHIVHSQSHTGAFPEVHGSNANMGGIEKKRPGSGFPEYQGQTTWTPTSQSAKSQVSLASGVPEQKIDQPGFGTAEGFHSLPAGVGQSDKLNASEANSSVDKPAFSSLPSELRKSAAVPPTASVQGTRTRLEGKDSSASDTGPIAETASGEGLVEQEPPPKDDLEMDQPPSADPSTLHAHGGAGYDPRLLQSIETKCPDRSQVTGSVAEHVMYAEGAGHRPARGRAGPQEAQGRYPHDYRFPYDPRYGPAPYHPGQGMPTPGYYPPGHGYPPYMPPAYPPRHLYGMLPHQYPYSPPPQAPPQNVLPERPQTQVHYHQHYHDTPTEREHVRQPQNITISRVDNVMMGESNTVNVKKSKRGRSQISVELPEFDEEVPEEYTLPGEEQPFASGDEQLTSRGGGTSLQPLPSSHGLGSRLTRTVSPDHSQMTSAQTCPPNAAEEAPRSNQYALRDLPTSGFSHSGQPTLRSGNTAMEQRPVCRAAPMQREMSWRQNYDEENQTELKRYAQEPDDSSKEDQNTSVKTMPP